MVSKLKMTMIVGAILIVFTLWNIYIVRRHLPLIVHRRLASDSVQPSNSIRGQLFPEQDTDDQVKGFPSFMDLLHVANIVGTTSTTKTSTSHKEQSPGTTSRTNRHPTTTGTTIIRSTTTTITTTSPTTTGTTIRYITTTTSPSRTTTRDTTTERTTTSSSSRSVQTRERGSNAPTSKSVTNAEGNTATIGDEKPTGMKNETTQTNARKISSEQTEARAAAGDAWKGQHCEPKTHFAYVKVHKCSSSTVASVMRKFAKEHNLVSALPGRSAFLMSLDPVRTDHIYRYEELEKKRVQIEVVYHHHIFNYTTWRNVLPKDTVYIAVMREPLDHLRSSLGYFGIPVKIPDRENSSRVATFLADPIKYSALEGDRVKTRFSWFKNYMAYALGYPRAQFDDMAYAKEYLEFLDERFAVILLTEYMYESFLLLRRKMCWSLRDVIFVRVNTFVASKPEYPPELYQRCRRWNNVDYLFYDFFKERLLSQIKSEPNFQEELGHFKLVNGEVNAFCEAREQKEPIAIPESKWNKAFSYSKEDCEELARSNNGAYKDLKATLDAFIDN